MIGITGVVGMILILSFFWLPVARAAGKQDYTALKKYLAARMYPEAYDELLRCELRNDKVDPKLVKLKREMLKNTRRDVKARLRTSPGDHMLNTVLADVEFQENQLDQGVEVISKALQAKASPTAHFILAKLLFAKGDLQQSYEAMEKAFQSDPSSGVLMADFQFLYNCKNYGVTTAKKLSENAEFLRRVAQVAAEKASSDDPVSPFENDPTQVTTVKPPPEPEPMVVKPPDQPVKPPKYQPGVEPGDNPFPDEPGSGEPDPAEPDPADPFADPDAVPPASTVAVVPVTPDPFESPDDQPEPPPPPPDQPPVDKPPVDKPVVPDVPDDPEQKKMAVAENLLKEAEQKLKEKAFEDARILLKKARNAFPGMPGLDEFEEKITSASAVSTKVEDEYATAVHHYENKNYELALPGILKGYQDAPDKHPEASFYLGDIYLLGPDKDLQKARSYYEKCAADPQTVPELKREIEWRIIGILADDEKYDEAYPRFVSFEIRERDFARSSQNYWTLKYLLTFYYFFNEFLIAISLFVVFAFLVLILRIFPSIGLFMGDPVKKAKGAFEAKNYERAVKVAEDALRRGQIPPVQKELLAICVESHYLLKNYYKCLDHAKHLRNLEPDHQVAFQFMARSFLDTKAVNDEAIAIYEEAYRLDPENKGYLPFLAKHYIQHKEYSMEALAIMFDYFQTDRGNRDNVLGLAEGYVQTKRMSEEVVPVMLEALKDHPERMEFRELLARNYAKNSQFSEAAKECLKILTKDVNNMGIHVVYTSCMKKMNMLEEAILQYEEFGKRYKGNAQINEILTGLRKELEQVTGPADRAATGDMAPFAEDLAGQELVDVPVPPPLAGDDIESFVEPPLDGFDPLAGDVPVPEFMKTGAEQPRGFANPVVPPVPELEPADFAALAEESGKLADLAAPNTALDDFLGTPVPAGPGPLDGPAPVGDGSPPQRESAVSGADSSGEIEQGELEKLISGSDDVARELWQAGDVGTASGAPGKSSGPGHALDEFIESDDLIPADVLGDDADLGGILDHAADLPGVPAGKPVKGGRKAGMEELPEDFVPEDDLTALTDFDPLGGEENAALMTDIDDLLGAESPSAAPAPAAGKPPIGKAPARGPGVPPPSVGGATAGDDLGQKIAEARAKAGQKKWDEVINVLSPVFAVARDQAAGVLIANAYLGKREPALAREILETLELDREMMGEEVKDALYRVGIASEDSGDTDGALKMYDIICNVDINYLDTFDRSDKLYRKKKA